MNHGLFFEKVKYDFFSTLNSDFNLFVFVYFVKCQNGNTYFLLVVCLILIVTTNLSLGLNETSVYCPESQNNIFASGKFKSNAL